MKHPFLAAVALALVSCESEKGGREPLHPRYERPASPESLRPFLEKASDSEIRARAVALARADVHSETPHVAWSGGYTLQRPNIPHKKEKLVTGLPPVEGLPMGSSDPLMRQGMKFAMAYNGEVVKHLPLSDPKPGKWPDLFHLRKVNKAD